MSSDTTNNSSPLREVEEDTIIQQVRLDLVKLDDTSSDPSLVVSSATIPPPSHNQPGTSPPSPRHRGNAFIAAKRPSDLAELGISRNKSSSLANARAKTAAWKSAAVRKMAPNSNPNSPIITRKTDLQNGTSRLRIQIKSEKNLNKDIIAPNDVVDDSFILPIGGSPPDPKNVDLLKVPRTSRDDSVMRESRKTREIADISQIRLGISTELILQKRRLFNKAVPQKLAPGVNFTSSDGVPATNPPDTTPLVSSDSAVLDYRTNSGPIKINNNNNTTKSQPWLNPLSTNSPNNTNGTLPAGTSPSTPSLLTAGTVLAVASSSNTNGSKVNGSSPNSTLRKKKGTPIKTGWLRLNNTIRWFELMKYKMVYYASNNEDEDPIGYLNLEFRVVELAKQDNNVTTIEFVTETLEKLYLTGFNEEETQVWFAAIKGVLNEWRQYASKYGSILEVGQWLGRKLLIYSGSWNVGNAAPPDDISAWVPKSGYDIYALGSQECAYEPRLGMTNAEDWFYRITSTLGDEYVTVEALSLWQIRLIVLVRRELAPFVSQIQKDSVACGIANVLGNKGAVGISFWLYDYSFCFISSHLAAHIEKVGKRNADYKEIISQMKLGNKDIDINNQFHYMFWLGDLNYRLEAPRETVLDLIKSTDLERLLALDQLFLWKHRGEVFHGFEEHTIAFMPTYRFDRSIFDQQGKRIYSEEKMRVPSWTDRVLWRGLPNCPIEVMKYDAVHSVATSDHSPIFCTFCVSARLTVPMWNSLHDKSPFIPSEGKEVFVKFSGLRAHKLKHLKEKGKKKDPNPYIKFIAPFLPNDQKWKTSIAKKTINPDWGDMKPIPITEKMYKEYLATQHIFLLIQSDEIQLHNAMLGQAVLSLAHCINQPYNFSLPISYNGKHHGTVEGTIQIDFPYLVAYGKTVVPVSTPIGVKKFVNILANNTTNNNSSQPETQI